MVCISSCKKIKFSGYKKNFFFILHRTMSSSWLEQPLSQYMCMQKFSELKIDTRIKEEPLLFSILPYEKISTQSSSCCITVQTEDAMFSPASRTPPPKKLQHALHAYVWVCVPSALCKGLCKVVLAVEEFERVQTVVLVFTSCASENEFCSSFVRCSTRTTLISTGVLN